MSMSEAQKMAAYREAQQVLRLDKTWTSIMPGERKPNFRRAAREIIRRALGHKVVRNEAPLDLHGGMMHEHQPREAALLERTLKNGMHPPTSCTPSSWAQRRCDTKATRAVEPKTYEMDHLDDPDLPDYEVFVHDHSTTIDPPSYYEPGTGVFHSSVHWPPEHSEVPIRAPPSTRLPSQYEAVH